MDSPLGDWSFGEFLGMEKRGFGGAAKVLAVWRSSVSEKVREKRERGGWAGSEDLFLRG